MFLRGYTNVGTVAYYFLISCISCTRKGKGTIRKVRFRTNISRYFAYLNSQRNLTELIFLHKDSIGRQQFFFLCLLSCDSELCLLSFFAINFCFFLHLLSKTRLPTCDACWRELMQCMLKDTIRIYIQKYTFKKCCFHCLLPYTTQVHLKQH